MPPFGSYCSSDLRRMISSSPTDRNNSSVRNWKCPARGWTAVPRWRSTLIVGIPCQARNIAEERPTRLPPTISTGTFSLVGKPPCVGRVLLDPARGGSKKTRPTSLLGHRLNLQIDFDLVAHEKSAGFERG